MKSDTKWVKDTRGNLMAMQSDGSNETLVALRIGRNWAYFERAAVVELIGNLVALLADLEE